MMGNGDFGSSDDQTSQQNQFYSSRCRRMVQPMATEMLRCCAETNGAGVNGNPKENFALVRLRHSVCSAVFDKNGREAVGWRKSPIWELGLQLFLRQ